MQLNYTIEGTSIEIALEESTTKTTFMGTNALEEATSNWGVLFPNKKLNLKFLGGWSFDVVSRG